MKLKRKKEKMMNHYNIPGLAHKSAHCKVFPAASFTLKKEKARGVNIAGNITLG